MPDVTIGSTTTQLKWQGGTAPTFIIESAGPQLTPEGAPVMGSGPFREEWTTTVNGSGYVVVPAVTLPSGVTYFAYFQKANVSDSASRYPFSVFGANQPFYVPDDTPTTWEDIDLSRGGGSGPITPADRTIRNLTVTEDADIAGDESVGGNLDVGGNGTFGGNVSAGTFTGSMAGGHSFPGGATLVNNAIVATGSAGINADSDGDGVGEAYLSINSVVKLRAKQDGLSVETTVPFRLPSYTAAGLPAAAAGNSGGLARLTDSHRGFVLSDGAAWLATNGGVYSVRFFGAKGDGSTNDTTAIQAAIDACAAGGGGVVFFPPGTYKVTGLSNATGHFVELVGSGTGNTVIAMSSASGNTLTLGGSGTGVDKCAVRNLRFQPSVTRNTNTNELYAPEFFDLRIIDVDFGPPYLGSPFAAGDVKIYRCMKLGSAPGVVTVYIDRIRAIGFRQLIKTVHVLDGWIGNISADALHADATTIHLDGFTEGVTWENMDLTNHPPVAAARTGFGILIEQDEETSRPARHNFFKGVIAEQHVYSLLSVDGGQNKFEQCYFGFCDDTSSDIGAVIGGTTDMTTFVDCHFVLAGTHGVQVTGNSTRTTFIGCVAWNNNWEALADGSGYVVDGTARAVTLIGCYGYKDSVWPSSAQVHGLWLKSGADDIKVTDCYFSSNAAAGVKNDAGISATIQFTRVKGYATENSGTATVANGTTSITVNHGLDVTPAAKDFRFTPSNSLGNATKYWVSGITSTQFVLNVNTDPGATTATFGWQVKVT